MVTLQPSKEMIADCLAARVRIVARTVTAIYDQAMATHDVTIAQVNLLAALDGMDSCPPGKLGEALQLERSTISRNLDLLIHKGLVAALSSDAKGIREVALTDAGRQKIQATLPDWRAAQERAGALLGQEGIDAVHQAAASVWRPPV
jgi:DNA-binding MarR family transcriptional regulator